METVMYLAGQKYVVCCRQEHRERLTVRCSLGETQLDPHRVNLKQFNALLGWSQWEWLEPLARSWTRLVCAAEQLLVPHKQQSLLLRLPEHLVPPFHLRQVGAMVLVQLAMPYLPLALQVVR